MNPSGICDGCFIAVTHEQGVNARQMGKGGISDGFLTAATDVQGVNAR